MHTSVVTALKTRFLSKKNNLSNKTRLAIGVGAFVFANALLSVLVLADDASIDQTLLVKWWGVPQVHDYVQFTLEESPILEKRLDAINRVFCSNEDAVETGKCNGIKVTKKVGCVAGDLLEVRKGNAFFCNHVLIGHAKDKTKDGQPLNVFLFNGTVPEGKLFAFGTNKDSYDSRYFGFVDVAKVQRLKGLFDAKPFISWVLSK